MEPPDWLPHPVRVRGPGNDTYPGTAQVRRWSSQEGFWRGGRRAAKTVAIIMGILLPLAILEPFAFMVWGSAAGIVLLVIVGPWLHLKYWSEQASFSHVDAECPHCHARGKLGPYVSTAFTRDFTVLCPACGQTASVRSEETTPTP